MEGGTEREDTRRVFRTSRGGSLFVGRSQTFWSPSMHPGEINPGKKIADVSTIEREEWRRRRRQARQAGLRWPRDSTRFFGRSFPVNNHICTISRYHRRLNFIFPGTICDSSVTPLIPVQAFKGFLNNHHAYILHQRWWEREREKEITCYLMRHWRCLIFQIFRHCKSI